MGRTVAQNARQAFTIIELLVVIAIIALLIALLVPALSRARRHSTYMVCTSLLFELSTAGHMYLNNSSDIFPEDPNEWLYSKASISKEHPIGCRWHDRQMAPIGEIMKSAVI